MKDSKSPSHHIEASKHFIQGNLHPIESKYMAGASVVGFLLALVLTHGSLIAAFGVLGLVAGTGWVAHHLLH